MRDLKHKGTKKMDESVKKPNNAVGEAIERTDGAAPRNGTAKMSEGRRRLQNARVFWAHLTS